MLEGIADGELWLWLVLYELFGSLNDINVMEKSVTMGKILSGDFPPRIAYKINGRSRTFDRRRYIHTLSRGGINNSCAKKQHERNIRYWFW